MSWACWGLSLTTPGRHFTERDCRVAIALADRVALAIENARLLALERQRQHQLQTVLEIGRELVGELDMTRLLPLITQRATELLGGHRGVLFRYEASEQRLISCASVNARQPGGVSCKLGDGVTGTAAAQQHGVMVNDYQTSSLHHPTTTAQDITAIIAQPLISAGRLQGVITVVRVADSGPFTDDDLTALEIFANMATIAIKNARSYEQERLARADTESRAQHLATLMAISNALSTSLKLDEVLQQVGPAILRSTQFEQLGIFLLEDDGQHLRGELIYPPSPHYQQGTSIPLAGSRTGWTFMHRQAMVVDDLAAEMACPFDSDTRLLQHGIRSSVYVPLCVGEHVFGTLNMHSRTPGVPTAENIALLQEIGRRLAVALHQARLFAALEEARDTAEAATRAKSEVSGQYEP